MRIIAGKYKSRKIYAPGEDTDLSVRPTSDRARESIFDMLTNILDFENVAVLDLFAGTGAFGFEALSRGAFSSAFVDRDGYNTVMIKKTAELLNCTDDVQVFKTDVFNFLRTTSIDFDLIFADPPYSFTEYNELIELIDKMDFLVFILEYERDTVLDVSSLDKEKYSFLDKDIGRSSFKFFIRQDK